jgi:HAD superfamily hydrolase (TIGR01484 family)
MKHFAIDIDGCITNGKGNFTNTKNFSKLQHYITDNDLSVFLCTGRSAPYVEAIAQLLHINQWCICENGAYLYHPMTDEIIYSPLINDNTLNAIAEFKTLLNTAEYKSICKLELGKEICISLNPIQGSIEDLYSNLATKIDSDLLYINHSTTAVDITPKGINKGSALQFLCEKENYQLEDIIAIGDTSGDLPFMRLSGTKACPANARQDVKDICDYISEFDSTESVLDILKYYFFLVND